MRNMIIDEKTTQQPQEQQPTDLEVMRVTKNVLVSSGGPMTVERRRNIYRIIKESGVLDEKTKS